MNQAFSRREFLAAMMAGGAVIAGELWVPGRKLISIPKPSVIVPQAEIWTPEDNLVNRIIGRAFVRDLWRGPHGEVFHTLGCITGGSQDRGRVARAIRESRISAIEVATQRAPKVLYG